MYYILTNSIKSQYSLVLMDKGKLIYGFWCGTIADAVTAYITRPAQNLSGYPTIESLLEAPGPYADTIVMRFTSLDHFKQIYPEYFI